MPSPTQETTTVLDALRESRREIHEEIEEQEKWLRELEARLEDMEEHIARLSGDSLCAEWHRLEAVSKRSRTPEARQASHASFVRYMADMHLRNGTEPGPTVDSNLAAEIRAAMDAQRAEVRQ